MKKLLIIYPHWYPVNLAGVHRPRLVCNYLKELGWETIVVTVKEEFYEEDPDPDFEKTFKKHPILIRVDAFKPPGRFRLVGDIGIRGFYFLYRESLRAIEQHHVSFIWIPIPSFYTSLIGRLLYEKTKTPYGIDYIDPWVRDISGRRDWKHLLSNMLSRYLEPMAVKKASLISGVSRAYYWPVLERNFKPEKTNSHPSPDATTQWGYPNRPHWFNPYINNKLQHTAFPYGFDPADHEIDLPEIQLPWSDQEEVKPWIYAGAFLPNSRLFVKHIFAAIAELNSQGHWDKRAKLYFVGTGSYKGESIRQIAAESGIETIVREDRRRYPFLHILQFLKRADTIMVIGSTEPHYTASKIFQAILSRRPVWAVLHEFSSAVQVLQECQADRFLIRYSSNGQTSDLMSSMRAGLLRRLKSSVWNPDIALLDKYSARHSAVNLTNAIDQVLLSQLNRN